MILVGLAFILRGALVKLMSDGQVELKTSDSWVGPIGYGLFGVGVLAVLEWISYARERWSRKPPGG